MGGAELDGARPDPEVAPDVAALLPMVRRIVLSRVPNKAAAEDLVQETLVKVLAAANRIEPGMLEPYAITTARHLITSLCRSQDTQRRNQHRVVEMGSVDAPDERLLKEEERAAVSAALEHLTEREQQTLLAHEVSGQEPSTAHRHIAG
jgi:serine/threonine-protein kinase RsbT